MQFAKKRSGQLARGVLLCHDNSRPHTARTTQKRTQDLQWELLEHLPHSLDLAPSDFQLFGPLKKRLGGKRFPDDEKVEKKVWKWLRQQSKDFYAAGRHIGKAMGLVYQCWWRICQEINVFPGSNIKCFMFYIHL
jgi:hypothetical protein